MDFKIDLDIQARTPSLLPYLTYILANLGVSYVYTSYYNN